MIERLASAIPYPRQVAPDERRAEVELIAGPLRLAAKYELTFLHRRLLEVLKVQWPTELRDWDEKRTRVTEAKLSDPDLPSPSEFNSSERTPKLALTASNSRSRGHTVSLCSQCPRDPSSSIL